MKRISWRILAVGLAVLGAGSGAGVLWASTAASKASPRKALPRRSALMSQAPLTSQALAKKALALQARALVGTYILFEYDGGLTKQLDLDDNGEIQDTGDRAIFQGSIWVSNRNGARIANTGRFTTIYDYLDLSGESTGTDLTQTTDLLIYNAGQIRAGGFWDVEDGVGDPALPVLGATGTKATRRYMSGQLIFLGEVTDGQELYFLAR
ncbi:MAG: hypothetical protein ACO1SX_22550 [Actinomycetota bacterium]